MPKRGKEPPKSSNRHSSSRFSPPSPLQRPSRSDYSLATSSRST